MRARAGLRRPLHRARRDENSCVHCTPTGDARNREDDEPEQNGPAPAPQVADPAAEQHEPGKGRQVRGDHPLQSGSSEAQIGADRGQRDVDQRDVQRHKELEQKHRRDQRSAVLQSRIVVDCAIVTLLPVGRCDHVRVRFRTRT